MGHGRRPAIPAKYGPERPPCEPIGAVPARTPCPLGPCARDSPSRFGGVAAGRARPAPRFQGRRVRRSPLGAVALLVLLARAAGARVIAADLVPLRRDPLLRRDRRRAGADRARSDSRRRAVPAGRSRGGDRLGTGERLVLVRVAPILLEGLHLLERRGVLRGHLRVEEQRDDLAPDETTELFEHQVPLVPVLDERVFLGHRPEVHALPEIVHVLEVLAPPLVDDLEDHVPLHLSRDLVAPRLRPLLVLLLGR